MQTIPKTPVPAVYPVDFISISSPKLFGTAIQATRRGSRDSQTVTRVVEDNRLSAPHNSLPIVEFIETAPTGSQVLLERAVEEEDVFQVQALVLDGVNVNVPPQKVRGRTPLSTAAALGNLGMLEILLRAGADVDAPPSEWYGRNALQAGAGQNHKDVVQRLLQAGADVNAPAARHYGRSALQIASEAGHEDIVELLLDAGADVNQEPACVGGRTALQASCHSGHGKIAQALLLAGADIDAPAAYERGIMALHASAAAGHEELMYQLILAGADINSTNANNGRTPLMVSAQFGHETVAKLLVERGADVSRVDINGRTALHVAASYGRTNLVRYLLSLPQIHVNAQDYNGATPLHIAAKWERDVVDILLQGCADPEVVDARSQRPLHVAFDSGSTDVINRLLTAWANTKDIPVKRWRTVFKAKQSECMFIAEARDTCKRIFPVSARQAIRRAEDYSSSLRCHYSTHATFGKPVIDPRFYMANYFDRAMKTPPRNQRATVEWMWSPIITNTAGSIQNEDIAIKEGITNRTMSLIPDLPNISNLAIAPRKVILICFVAFDFFVEASRESLERARSDGVGEDDEAVDDADDEDLEPGQPETSYFRTEIDEAQISWIMLGPTSRRDIVALPAAGRNFSRPLTDTLGDKTDAILHSIDFRSSMDCCWIPDHSIEFLTMFINDLHEKWNNLFDAADLHLSDTRERLLLNKGKETELIDHLLKDAQKWGDFRVLLQIHVRKARSLVADFEKNSYLYEEVMLFEDQGTGHDRDRPALDGFSLAIKRLEEKCEVEISKLDARTKEMINLEFSLVSIYEAQRSTTMAASMKRLSWITFIFLPLMFVSSLFGMNVNLLTNDPDWRWFLGFTGCMIAIIIIAWVFFKYSGVETFFEDKVDGFLAALFRRISRRPRPGRRRGRDTSRRKRDLENGRSPAAGEEPECSFVMINDKPWQRCWVKSKSS